MTAVLDDTEPLIGSTTPRLHPAPLARGLPGPCGCGCALTPRTSRGFEAETFALDVLGIELLPWQRWWLIHALETVPALGRGAVKGRKLRFRVVLTLVGRQQGKSTLLTIVILYFMVMGYARLVLGVAQDLGIADERWNVALEMAEDSGAIDIPKVIRGNGKTMFQLKNGARYRTAAATRSAGRGLSVELLPMDEIREQRNWDAWAALSKTMMARPGALLLPTSNAGDDQSVVLNQLRAAALAGGEDAPALFEWSAPDGCDLDDRDGWRQAMPGLGITIDESAVRSARKTDPPAVFRTELLCQHVDVMERALDLDGWKACADTGGSLAGVRDRVVLVLHASPDSRHVTVALAAPVRDDRVRVEIAGAWSSTDLAMAALPDLVDKIRPRAVGWYPAGPGAVFTADLERLYDFSEGSGRRKPRYAPDLHPITGAAVPSSSQGLADIVDTRRLLHPDDPLLNAQATSAQRKDSPDGGWRFVRIGDGAAHVDAVEAVAGAVHIARTLPPPARRPKVY